MKIHSKIYKKLLDNWSWRKIPFQKGVSGEFRIAIRSGKEQFLLSNPTASGILPERFAELVERIKDAKDDEMRIEITYIRKFGKFWIEEVQRKI